MLQFNRKRLSKQVKERNSETSVLKNKHQYPISLLEETYENPETTLMHAKYIILEMKDI